MTDISSGTEIRTPSGFTVGDVFGRSFSVLARHFVQFAVISGIAMIPYLFLFSFQARITFAQPGTAPVPSPQALAYFGLSAVAGFVLMMFAQASIAYAAFQDMTGRPVRVGPSLRIGLSRFLPIIGLIIVAGLGIGAGMILLVIPGVILAIMWTVGMPACVVEKLSPLKSLARSAALTKGHRWKIFAIFLLVLVGGSIAGGIISAILVLFRMPIVFTVGNYLWQTVYVAFTSILYVVIYRDLRVAKEGISTHQIAAVFD